MMRLGYFVNYGGPGAWRLPGSGIERQSEHAYYADIARALEAARFDFLFRGDLLSFSVPQAETSVASYFEPLTFLASLIPVTERLGLVATVSTSFSEPFNVARAFATLDHLSGGRIGWNIVTSGLGAEQFGEAALPDESARYARAREYVDVVTALWQSWDRDAMVLDRASGQYADASKIGTIDHRGDHFTVAGPLNIERSPQTHPVFVQAGGSDLGRAFGADVAEILFSASPTIDVARQYYTDMRHRIAAAGRVADDVAVMTGVSLIIGTTRAEARELQQYFRDQIDLVAGVRSVESQLGVSLADLELDEPIPAERLVGAGAGAARKGRASLMVGLAADPTKTLRDVIVDMNTNGVYWQPVGSPVDIADALETWFTTGAADGFMLTPAHYPDGLGLFLEEVVPILQERGLARTEYEDGTFRENLGLVPIP